MNDSSLTEDVSEKIPESKAKFDEFGFYFIGILILTALYFLSITHFLLFHGVAESFSIVIACGIYMVVWNSRQFIDNDYFLLVGVAYLFIAFLDLLHLLAYNGMGVFPGRGSNLPTQIWTASRYLQAATFVIAPLFIKRKINIRLVYILYIVVSAAIVLSIFYWRNFPICFVNGIGLTEFKIYSEYIISAALGASVYLLYLKRSEFNRNILALVAASIIVTIISEIFFTLYTTSYGLLNTFGHIFKIMGCYLLYKAIIQTGLRHPIDLLFHKLKQSEEALQLTRYSIDRAEDLIIWIRPDCTISDINNTTSRKLGYKPKELLSRPVSGIVQGLNPDVFKNIWNEINSKGTFTVENKMKMKNGIEFETEAEYNYVNFGNEEYCCTFFRDITERKAVENALHESERRFRILADNAPVLIWMSGLDNKCSFCNNTWLEFTGRNLEEELGDGWLENIHPGDMEKFLKAYYKNTGQREGFSIEYRMKRKDDQYRWISFNGVPRFTPEGNFVGYIGTGLDVNEQKMYREQIENSLREKVILLKEIHHRVKNNLQVISSLFRLQSFYIKDKDALSAFLESQDRVKSMALVHEKLYLSQNFSQINFSQYIHDLIRSILSSYRFNSNSIDFEINVNDVELNVDTAVNLGLILNELISNIFKHAFPDGVGSDGEKCRLTISLKTENGSYMLVVKDNGIGFRENFDISDSETLGLQLVTSLVEQQKGEIKFFNDKGANYVITFPK